MTIPFAAAAGLAAMTLWPLPPPVLAEFDPPVQDWLAGHRGVDLAATPGAVVRNPRPGVVMFSGRVAGTPVVVISHGSARATYQAVRTELAPGTAVAEGEAIGVVAATGIAHCPNACLHWGLRTESGYLDPRLLLGRLRVVLMPTDP